MGGGGGDHLNRDLHGTLTVLIVAHRLQHRCALRSTAALFEDGQLRRTGSFALQRDDSLFADLVAHGSLT
jgi:hypothetical protein